MEIPPQKTIEMLAYEAFIRRAALVAAPFMLKGSYVTRQYFKNSKVRVPADMDWVYLHRLTTVEEAADIFDAWATQITEMDLDDGVKFRSFKEEAYWKMIEYAMSEDFPTVTNWLKCWVDGVELPSLRLDISLNLDIEVPPVPFLYQPLRGEPFMFPFTTPLALQVAWKIHQTLVNPRFKDLFDLIYLLQDPNFDDKARRQALQALVNECAADDLDIFFFHHFLRNQLDKLFPYGTIKDRWDYWRHGYNKNNRFNTDYIENPMAGTIHASVVPDTLLEFQTQFGLALQHAGFTIDLIPNLPKPTRNARASLQTPIPEERKATAPYIEKQPAPKSEPRPYNKTFLALEPHNIRLENPAPENKYWSDISSLLIQVIGFIAAFLVFYYCFLKFIL